MAISGPEALHSLDEALRDIRREEDEIAKRLARSAELVTKIRATEGDLFRQLAKVRLDPTTQAELGEQLTAAERAAREQLKRHGAAVTSAEAKLKTLDANLAALGAERIAKLAEVQQHEDALKAISQRIAAGGRDAAYAKAEADATALRHVAEESLAKTAQAETDREEKGRPYRDDPLFMYLWDRKYGTSEYKAGNLTRYLDGRVARLIRYDRARPNYAMLNEIPLRLREHAERQAEAATASQQALEVLQTAAIDAAGGRPIREALEAARARIAAIDEAVVKAEDERDDAIKAQRDLAQGDDPTFAAAIAGLGEALGREDLKQLLEEARLTRTAQDDTIVTQIEDARQRATEEDNEAREQKQRLKTLADRRRELEDIQFEFKKSRYDDPRSTFRDSGLVGDVLTDFLRGGISATSYWDRWRQSQNWSGGRPSQRSSSPWGQPTGRYTNDTPPPLDERELSRQDADGSFQWPDMSFGGGSGNWGSGGSRRGSSGLGHNWGRLPGTGSSNSGGFSRPRTGGGFHTGGSAKGGGFKTGGGF